MPFFTFDIEDAIMNGEWQTAEIDGKTAIQRRIELQPIQMDMFNLLDVTKFPDGTIWLDFLSDAYAPKKPLMDFMAHCTSLWGTDSQGKGVPSQSDMDPLRRGTFARTWQNVKIAQINLPEKHRITVILRIIIDNQDMSNFAKNLAKGFIRSAVNQVGRDGGRVISNNLYNGNNYVPLKNVGDSPQMGQPAYPKQGTPMPDAVASTKLGAGAIILIVLGVLAVPLGPVAVLIYGLSRYLKNTTKIKWTETQPQYVQDRRCKDGVRYIGKITVTRSNVIPADDFSKSEYRRQGIIIMIAGAASLLLGIISLIFS